MASPTTTRVYQPDSAYLAVRPFSAAPLTDAEKAAQSAFVQTTLDTDKMAALMAERKRINDMINEQKTTDKTAKDEQRAARKAEQEAAKANEPSKLEKAIARQAKSRVWIGSVI